MSLASPRGLNHFIVSYEQALGLIDLPLICIALVVPEHPDQVRPSEAKIIYKWFIILPSDSSVWH